MCKFLCFDDSPIESDPKAYRPNTFQISMCDAICENQPVCLIAYMCPCCCAYSTRLDVIDKDVTRYSCCQGYLNNPCFTAGQCGEQNSPRLCLALETICCLGPSMSSSRMFMMDQYDLRPDPCDNRIVRFTNCLMLASCVCDILSIFLRELRHGAHILRMVADCVFYSTIGCMASQVHKELAHRKAEGTQYNSLMGSEYNHHSSSSIVGIPILEEARVTKQPQQTVDL